MFFIWFFRILQSFFGLQFGQNADIDIILENQDERKMGEIKDENGRKERMYLFYDGESLSGKVWNVIILTLCSVTLSENYWIEEIFQLENLPKLKGHSTTYLCSKFLSAQILF